jgi:hypothetical protein
MTEAVMRPEWTRAVGQDWINAANRAARDRGVAGVADFIARTAPRPGSIEGRAGDGNKFARGGTVQRFLTGGVIRLGDNPFTVQPPKVHMTVATELRDKMIPVIRKRLAELEAAARAAAAGGPVTAGADAALRWARTQVGKPYIWGGVGPGGYDCSGFMSALVNVMRGKNPHSRVGATSNFPWPGFRPGFGSAAVVGIEPWAVAIELVAPRRSPTVMVAVPGVVSVRARNRTSRSWSLSVSDPLRRVAVVERTTSGCRNPRRRTCPVPQRFGIAHVPSRVPASGLATNWPQTVATRADPRRTLRWVCRQKWLPRTTRGDPRRPAAKMTYEWPIIR